MQKDTARSRASHAAFGPSKRTASAAEVKRIAPTPNSALCFSVTRQLAHFLLDITAELPPGITVLFGASGSGKTTILKLIAGLTHPDRGQITLNGELLFDSDRHLNLSVSQRRVGMVFQQLALFPHLTAAENIAYGLAHRDPASRDREVSSIAAAFRIASVLHRRPVQLSGGEQQRVALARTLVTEPRALLLDEPLSALDPGTKSHIMEDLRTWIAAHHVPVLYVTHSREEVFAMAQRVIALEKGKIVGQGTPREVLGGVHHQAIAEWSALENIFDGTIAAMHEEQGIMTFRTGNLDLEVPLSRARVGEQVRIGVSAHDVLLAVSRPSGLSARNILPGRIVALRQQDAVYTVAVSCNGVELAVYVTPAAVQSLHLESQKEVWVVVKSSSCFLLAP